MAIDPNFEETYEHEGTERGVDVWGPTGPPATPGIRGTRVAVPFVTCVCDGACLEDCPVDVFECVDTPDHPESDIKPNPTAEAQCTDCTLCVYVCPSAAFDVDPGRENRL